MADKKLNEVTQASSASTTDNVIIIQSDAVRRIPLPKLQLEMGSVAQLELTKQDGYIKWRANNEDTWKNLLPLTDIKGEQGVQGVQGNPGRDGTNGKDGTDGINGSDGKDGVSPSFSIGEVNTIENNQPASVTIGGTKENVILNFSIPKGLNGTGAGDVTTSQLEAAIASIKIPKTLAELTGDATHRTVTDEEKTTWNNKSTFSGSYNDLIDKPNLFSGDYNDLSGKPTLITEARVNELINAKLPKSAEEVQY